MPKTKRERRERTDNYHLLQQWCRTPEQRLYEGIRPITLFGTPSAERAQETDLAKSSLRRAADAFDTHGMISLFRPDLRSKRGSSSIIAGYTSSNLYLIVLSWQGAKIADARFVTDYNAQPHWAHRKRDDNGLNPAEVLGQETSKLRTPEQLHRIFMLYAFCADSIDWDMSIFDDGNSMGKRRWLAIPP
jgi:hypothetical protein